MYFPALLEALEAEGGATQPELWKYSRVGRESRAEPWVVPQYATSRAWGATVEDAARERRYARGVLACAGACDLA